MDDDADDDSDGNSDHVGVDSMVDGVVGDQSLDDVYIHELEKFENVSMD